MNIARLAACIVASLLAAECGINVVGQDSQPGRIAEDRQERAVALDDPRLVELKKAYRQRLQELNQQLIADVQRLGAIEPPSLLETVEQSRGSWSWSGSLGGIANHSISVGDRDIAETESWPHVLDTPPLDPRSALAIATKTIESWYRDGEATFRLQRLSLVPLLPKEGKWYWEATYDVSRGLWNQKLSIAIRMDGKILTCLSSKQPK